MNYGEKNYFMEVESHILNVRMRGLMLGGSDFAMIEKWERMGIPLDIVKKGIDFSVDSIRFGSRDKVRGIINLSACSRKVLELWKDCRTNSEGRNDYKPAGREDSSGFLCADIEKMMERLEVCENDGGSDYRVSCIKNVIPEYRRECENLLSETREAGLAGDVIAEEKAAEKMETIRENLYRSILPLLEDNDKEMLLAKWKKRLRQLESMLDDEEYRKTKDELLILALNEKIGL